MNSHLGLIVKATRYCNLRCSYCHDWRTGPGQRMSFEVLTRMTASALRDSASPSVEFIWHGGEPTLLPIAFYEKALFVQSRFQQPGQVVRNSLQTNGTRLSPEWIRFLVRNDFAVSVSLDGPPALHDRYRRYASDRPSSQDVLAGIALLREHGVRASVLMVIDEDALELGPDAIFDFFLEAGIGSFGLLSATPDNQRSATPGTSTEHYVDPERMGKFLLRMYDRWEEHGDPRIRIRELEGLKSRLRREPPRVCTLAGGCLGQYFAVEPDGGVAHCDLFVGDDRYVLGNVRESGFDELRDHPKLTELRERNAQSLERMRSCPEYGVCNGWCPHERYLGERHRPDHDAACCGLRETIEQLRKRMSPAASASVG